MMVSRSRVLAGLCLWLGLMSVLPSTEPSYSVPTGDRVGRAQERLEGAAARPTDGGETLRAAEISSSNGSAQVARASGQDDFGGLLLLSIVPASAAEPRDRRSPQCEFPYYPTAPPVCASKV